MNPERWQQIRQVFEQAVAIESHQRSDFLDKACATDPELRREVESLLSYESRARGDFLKTPAIDLLEPATRPSNGRIGHRVGVYQILQQIGHGGMGEVYRAVRADGQYEKQVAIKFVRVGLDTAFILQRFRYERQILASLDHPNIARLYDGGTTEDGIPYLVMELIEGTPIDQYCEDHDLSLAERLQLFTQVCAAVQYAHQRLVIHRDIKPGNILVTAEGVPKLLDFGIAKIFDPSAGAETTLIRSMTPEYASPEQIRGEPITTATDVYSLGVVLYRLLTGWPPYRENTRTPLELARAISEVEPERPSVAVLQNAVKSQSLDRDVPDGTTSKSPPTRLRRALAGDLDNIVLKALRKEPDRRYASAEQLAEDIRCHLGGLPVAARRDSWSYVAGKFVRRHKVGMAATLLIVLVVLAGVMSTVREAQIAAANARRAQERFNDVRKLAHSLMFEMHDAIRDLPGSTSARRLLVTRALEYLDSLNQQAKGDISLQRELAAAYERVGDVLGYPYAANLGDKPGALQSYRKALAIREALVAADPNDARLQQELAGNYFRVAEVLEAGGDFAEALEAVRKALLITQRMPAGKNDSAQADRLAGGYYFTANLLVQTGDPAAALENYQRAASIREAALEADHESVPLRTHLAADYAGIAKSLEQKGDLVRAIQMQTRVIGILDAVSKASPTNSMLREYLGEAINRLATYRDQHDEAAAALETYRKAHQIFRTLRAADSNNSLAKSNFAFSDNGIGHGLVALGKPASAIEVFREAITTFEEMSPTTGSNRYLRTGLAQAYAGLGAAYTALAAGENTPANEKRELWEKARSACQNSLALWNDKVKRGELESGEREEPQQVAHCIAESDSQLRISRPGNN
jgi:non-specific serine/threonine protein kinase/serine/threonine-protein kinase